MSGTLSVSGAKNSALPILAATLIAPGEYQINNIPSLKDVEVMLRLLEGFGLQVKKTSDNSYQIINKKINNATALPELVKEMRASFLVMGPLLAGVKEAKVSMPGGCAIGARPVNFHLDGFEKLGTKISIEHGYVQAKTDELKGAAIEFPMVSVTGTENIIMAAAKAKGRTIIKNSACEPEVGDLCRFLIKMGARIEGLDTNQLVIDGVENLVPCEYEIIPDRIEAGTFIILSALFGGAIEIKNAVLEHLPAFKAKLEEMGIKFSGNKNNLRLIVPEKLKAISIETSPFPGFPTDLQAQMMVLLSCADNESCIEETIFENRFMHVDELNRLGAEIQVEGNTAIINGPVEFTGAEVKATDLRAGASLVLAGLIAKSLTTINEAEHIERGYENLAERLQAIGAKIARVE